jgi:hypothetical protein
VDVEARIDRHDGAVVDDEVVGIHEAVFYHSGRRLSTRYIASIGSAKAVSMAR